MNAVAKGEPHVPAEVIIIVHDGLLPTKESLEILRKGLADPDEENRQLAIVVLRQFAKDAKPFLTLLVKIIETNDIGPSLSACVTILQVDANNRTAIQALKLAVPQLIQEMNSQHKIESRLFAAEALGAVAAHCKEALMALKAARNDSDKDMRREIKRALGKVPDK
jgi:HEAT repeat protein